MTIKIISRFLLTFLMVVVGTLHFVRADFFLKIMPPYIPLHQELVYLSGICEIGLGLALQFPRYSRIAAWGIIGLLIAVFPANIYVYQHQDVVPAPQIVHFLRLPLQGLLILWAYCYTKRVGSKSLKSCPRIGTSG